MHFDVCIDWWPNNVDNAQRSVTLSHPWYDASLIFVWIPPEPNSDQVLFSFFAPFSIGVWVLTAATLVVSGFIFLLFEKMDTPDDEITWDWWKATLREHVFLSAITFTGNFSYTPRSNPARLFAWSFTFLSLVWAVRILVQLLRLMFSHPLNTKSLLWNVGFIHGKSC